MRGSIHLRSLQLIYIVAVYSFTDRVADAQIEAGAPGLSRTGACCCWDQAPARPFTRNPYCVTKITEK